MVCHACKKHGHIARVCRSRQPMRHISNCSSKPICVEVKVNKKKLSMEVGIGARVSQETKEEMIPESKLLVHLKR